MIFPPSRGEQRVTLVTLKCRRILPPVTLTVVTLECRQIILP
jgi:hypothetical protein